MDKTVVTISRKWHSPQISTTVDREGIELQMQVSDFAEAIMQEIGPVTWTFTDRAFRLKFTAAIERVIQGIKEESAKVV